MQFAWCCLWAVVSWCASFEVIPRFNQHRLKSTTYGFSHSTSISDYDWRATFRNDGIVVRIREGELRVVRLTGMKVYVRIKSEWLELQPNLSLPLHCELLAVPEDFEPFGSIYESIVDMERSCRPFAVAHLFAGDRLAIHVVEDEIVETPRPSTQSGILLLVGAFTLAAFAIASSPR